MPNSHEEVSLSRQRIAKEVKDLKTTKWRDARVSLSDVSGDDYYYLVVVKRSRPLLFQVVASEWEVPLDLLGLIEEVAVECGLPRMK